MVPKIIPRFKNRKKSPVVFKGLYPFDTIGDMLMSPKDGPRFILGPDNFIYYIDLVYRGESYFKLRREGTYSEMYYEALVTNKSISPVVYRVCTTKKHNLVINDVRDPYSPVFSAMRQGVWRKRLIDCDGFSLMGVLIENIENSPEWLVGFYLEKMFL